MWLALNIALAVVVVCLSGVLGTAEKPLRVVTDETARSASDDRAKRTPADTSAEQTSGAPSGPGPGA